MKNNKLILLLSAFSRKEMTRFRDFAHSPYFNKHEEVRRVVDYLEGIFPKFTTKNCDRERMFTQIFPQQKHDQKHLALLFTYTFRLLEKFLIIEQQEKDEFRAHFDLLFSLREKEQEGVYLKTLSRIKLSLNDQTLRNKSYFLHAYQLADEADQYYAQSEASFKKDESLQEKQTYLDHYYISEKLTDACEMLTRSAIIKIDYDAGLLEQVIKEVKTNEARFEKIPSIVVYYRIYQMLTNRDQIYFEKATQTVLDNKAFFSEGELYKIYSYLLSFCVAQINNNRPTFLRKLFKLYQLGLDQQLIFENGLLSEWHYKNIVTVGVRVEEMEWVVQFIEEYKNRLEADLAENAYRYNLGYYYHSIGEYEEVLPLLIKVEYTDRRYGIGARSLLIRTYYDMDEYEAFLSLAEAFKQFIQRDKSIKPTRKKGLHNLIKYTKRAFQIRSRLDYQKKEKNQKDLEKLSTEIDQESNIINKIWLKQKVDVLMGL